MKPIFTIDSIDLRDIRAHYCREINTCKKEYGNIVLDYIMFLENEINRINLELIKRGEQDG